MNKICDLLNKEVVIKLFKKEILPLYPDFCEVADVEIIEHKKNIWQTTYHVVLEFRTTFFDRYGQKNILPIFCTAHSSEPRQNVYNSLKFLWNTNFGHGDLSIPHALFYSAYYNGTFYRGVDGCNLYKFIRENQRAKVEKMIPQVATWFAKLHSTPIINVPNFNEANSRIETVYPGVSNILELTQKNCPRYYQFYKTVYAQFIEREEKFLASTSERWLVHGDAHPENIIKMSDSKIAVIDFADLCLSDFARDLGSFLQQTEYMILRKLKDNDFATSIKKLFLDNYLKAVGIDLDSGLSERIMNYYHWTAMRTATYFLFKYEPDAERARIIIEKMAEEMKINITSTNKSTTSQPVGEV